jgi:hypothetical protein
LKAIGVVKDDKKDAYQDSVTRHWAVSMMTVGAVMQMG